MVRYMALTEQGPGGGLGRLWAGGPEASSSAEPLERQAAPGEEDRAGLERGEPTYSCTFFHFHTILF